MKKRIISIILLIALFIMPRYEVFAASASGSIKVSTSNTVVGNSGTATLTISSDVPIAQIWGTFSCGGLGKVDLSYSATTSPGKSKSYTINWKATKTGSYTCQVSGLEVGILDGSDTGAWPSVAVSSKTIKVIAASSGSSSGSSGGSNSGSTTKPSGGTTSNKKEYSSDNTLKSLSVEGQNLNPKFDKNTTEYKLTVDQSIEKLKISATTNHDKATVSGTGEVKLSSGENTFEIKVTAENGNDKVYKIKVTVEDLNPIKVKVGEEEFTIIKKNNDLIDKIDHYEENILKIDDQDVVSYKNPKTNVTLVILKDKDNKVDYYVLDKNNYTRYRSVTVNGITLQLLDSTEKLVHYKKYDLELQDEKIEYFKIKASHKVGLIYGTNVKTGNTGYYVYDQNEETLSKYYDEEIKLYQEDIKEMKNYLMIFIGVSAFIMIIIIIISLTRSKKNKKRSYKI